MRKTITKLMLGLFLPLGTATGAMTLTHDASAGFEHACKVCRYKVNGAYCQNNHNLGRAKCEVSNWNCYLSGASCWGGGGTR